jgi:hypothetical protein
MQDGKPLGFYSKKLNETQRHYPVTEHELLVVETLKYYCNMLLGHKIIVCTDHKYYCNMLLGHKIIVRTDHKNLIHPASSHSSDSALLPLL